MFFAAGGECVLASGACSGLDYEIISRSPGQLWVNERLWFVL